jgi:hypothetical protein
VAKLLTIESKQTPIATVSATDYTNLYPRVTHEWYKTRRNITSDHDSEAVHPQSSCRFNQRLGVYIDPPNKQEHSYARKYEGHICKPSPASLEIHAVAYSTAKANMLLEHLRINLLLPSIEPQNRVADQRRLLSRRCGRNCTMRKKRALETDRMWTISLLDLERKDSACYRLRQKRELICTLVTRSLNDCSEDD